LLLSLNFFFKKYPYKYRVCLQAYFKCEEGFEGRKDQVATKACKKLVVDMIHEAKIQAVVTYYGSKLGQRVKKADAKTMDLTREQYIEVHENIQIDSF